MNFDLSNLRQKFKDRDYKLTPQRQFILQVFINNRDKHLSAEDVHNIVRQQANDIGLATVYRTLELLSELEILQKIDFGDGRSRYEINETNSPHHHHHLICLTCGRVIEFADDLMEDLENIIAKSSNFTIVDHQVKFYGYCQECRKKRDD
ncbi:Ferric uptake regulation protein [Sporomusa silvacetica DSM 10669]|uniref:Ferric uptake regulation protein n=1 Tax=Sporomusa silvacetica DSM 10669 TaxID=1123289 RepID=A0ABZ3ILR4_9FIRM|nr:Fur family transcriptional regulator [Sporomusa silvacetica]OZC21935.1 ferric uptake regulation protein [Sporomusa silvacetica DSM 10669]